MRNKLACSLLFITPFLAIKTCKNPNISPCYDRVQIIARWRNDYSLVQDCDSKGKVIDSYKIYPNGFFELKENGGYSVLSDEVPLDGKWSLNNDCTITLDKNNPNQRTFGIEKLTADSLIIWRKDAATLTVYTQHYVKH